jgi:hypothetical protein
MEMKPVERGYYSLVRYRSDPTRGEGRNIAVVLVDAEGQFGGVKMARASTLSQNEHQRGFLDTMLRGLQAQFNVSPKPDLSRLKELSDQFDRSVEITEPLPTAVPDPEQTLEVLYKAFVARPAGGGEMTKGDIADKVQAVFLKQGFVVRRSHYVKDVNFDLVVDRPQGQLACEFLSFVTRAKTERGWLPVERDAGHFLYGLERVELKGMAVVQPPVGDSPDQAQASFARISKWFDEADVPVHTPEQVPLLA